jgi:hypothetical protein
MKFSQQQLSKLKHYDYSLSLFIIPITQTSGVLKRDDLPHAQWP